MYMSMLLKYLLKMSFCKYALYFGHLINKNFFFLKCKTNLYYNLLHILAEMSSHSCYAVFLHLVFCWVNLK